MFFDIFQDLCTRKGVSCKRAAEEIGLSNSITTKWKKTGATPSGETLSRIAGYFEVSTDFLLGKEPEVPLIDTTKQDDILDEVDIAFYGNFKELTDANKETIRAMARVMLEQQTKDK